MFCPQFTIAQYFLYNKLMSHIFLILWSWKRNYGHFNIYHDNKASTYPNLFLYQIRFIISPQWSKPTYPNRLTYYAMQWSNGNFVYFKYFWLCMKAIISVKLVLIVENLVSNIKSPEYVWKIEFIFKIGTRWTLRTSCRTNDFVSCRKNSNQFSLIYFNLQLEWSKLNFYMYFSIRTSFQFSLM